MAIINLRKYYYPIYKKDTFVEVSDEVAEALLLLLREENKRERKLWYHKAFSSLDRDDGIENDAIGWEQPPPEELIIAAAEGVSPSQVSDSVRSAIKKLQKHFKKQKWMKE